jgi:aminoglycoside 3-N-acetyltransferase
MPCEASTTSASVPDVEYATVASIEADLRTLGVAPGGALLVHASYRSLGEVIGGPQAVVEALLAAAGTIVVPAHTPEISDPASWSNPPVPESWWEPIRHESPGFDPDRTPTSRWMGRLAELVRTWPGALRSNHPQVSFAAVGPLAAEITAEHDLADGLGDRSPLGAVYRLDGQILLLGCGHDANTSLHLAESRRPDPPTQTTGASIRRPGGGSTWTTWSEVVADASDFERLGAAFEKTGAVAVGPVAAATSRLMRQREAVDFATAWLGDNRSA